MIDFVSLFVGLIVGVHDVEVVVSAPVVRVEISLDEKTLAAVDGPPWVARCDFGFDPRPAILAAEAFDADGRQVGRAERWINLPGRRADAEIVPIRGPDGTLAGARLTWSSPEFEQPRRIRVTLDDRPIRVRPPYVIDLTDLAEHRVHVLAATFHFAADVVVRRELVFGADFEGDHDSGLTAVAVRLEDIDELPAPGKMAGWFRVDGAPADVAAVENPDARLVVVRDPAAVGRLSAMLPELERRRRKASTRARRMRRLDVLDDDTEIFALSPEPVHPPNRRSAAVLFPFSDRPTPGPDGIVAATVGRAPASLMGGPLMMSDAVAMAGIRAAEGNRRRMVVLMLGPRRQDGSRFAAETARRYLADLGVPLVVWDLSGPGSQIASGWGEAKPVDTVDDLVRQVRRLRYRLGEQRIVWLRGRHLPQTVELTELARGIVPAR